MGIGVINEIYSVLRYVLNKQHLIMGQAFGKKHPIIPDDDGVSSVASSKDSFASRASVLSRSSIGSILRKKKKIVEDKSYRDPPLPNFGKPVEYSLMTDRYYKAVIATRNLNGNIQSSFN